MENLDRLVPDKFLQPVVGPWREYFGPLAIPKFLKAAKGKDWLVVGEFVLENNLPELGLSDYEVGRLAWIASKEIPLPHADEPTSNFIRHGEMQEARKKLSRAARKLVSYYRKELGR